MFVENETGGCLPLSFDSQQETRVRARGVDGKTIEDVRVKKRVVDEFAGVEWEVEEGGLAHKKESLVEAREEMLNMRFERKSGVKGETKQRKRGFNLDGDTVESGTEKVEVKRVKSSTASEKNSRALLGIQGKTISSTPDINGGEVRVEIRDNNSKRKMGVREVGVVSIDTRVRVSDSARKMVYEEKEKHRSKDRPLGYPKGPARKRS